MSVAASKELFWGFYLGVSSSFPEKKIEGALQETLEKVRVFFEKAIRTHARVDYLFIAPRGYVDFCGVDEIINNTVNSYAKITVDLECFEKHVEPALEEMAERLNFSLEKKSVAGKIRVFVYSLVPFCETK